MSEHTIGTVARKWLLAITAVTMIMAAMSFATAPEAEAQGAQYATDLRLAPGSSCPAGTLNVGTIPSGTPLAGTWCRPAGFVPVIDSAQCAAAGGVVGATTYFTGGTVCAVFGVAIEFFPGNTCPAPLRTGFGTSPAGDTTNWCLVTALTNMLASGGVVAPGATAACIESATVQDSEAAAGLGLGSEFTGSDGVRYHIIGGEATCTFGCDDGFDANCDNKHGDFCPVELNVTTVKGVKECLAHLNPAPATAPLAETAVEAVSVPAAVAVPVTTLAHTGTESVLAYAGAALVAYGAVALGVQRHLKVRREDEA